MENFKLLSVPLVNHRLVGNAIVRIGDGTK